LPAGYRSLPGTIETRTFGAEVVELGFRQVWAGPATPTELITKACD